MTLVLSQCALWEGLEWKLCAGLYNDSFEPKHSFFFFLFVVSSSSTPKPSKREGEREAEGEGIGKGEIFFILSNHNLFIGTYCAADR